MTNTFQLRLSVFEGENYEKKPTNMFLFTIDILI